HVGAVRSRGWDTIRRRGVPAHPPAVELAGWLLAESTPPAVGVLRRRRPARAGPAALAYTHPALESRAARALGNDDRAPVPPTRAPRRLRGDRSARLPAGHPPFAGAGASSGSKSRALGTTWIPRGAARPRTWMSWRA